MAYFRSLACTLEDHHRCLDGAALTCVCACHRESRSERLKEKSA